MSKHFRRAHRDENLIVEKHWNKNHPALRVPISGGGRSIRGMWKGDVFAVVGKGVFEIDLVRRTSKNSMITFYEKEIKEVVDFGLHLKKLGNEVIITCVAHFPYKGWFKLSLNDYNYSKGNVQVDQKGKWILE